MTFEEWFSKNYIADTVESTNEFILKNLSPYHLAKIAWEQGYETRKKEENPK